LAGVTRSHGGRHRQSTASKLSCVVGAGPDSRPLTIGICFETIGRLGVSQLPWRIANTTMPGRAHTAVEPALVPLGHAE